MNFWLAPQMHVWPLSFNKVHASMVAINEQLRKNIESVISSFYHKLICGGKKREFHSSEQICD